LMIYALLHEKRSAVLLIIRAPWRTCGLELAS
jgi:hypothetical protein